MSFSRGWHWDLFQRYNAEALRLVAAYDWVTMVDVTAMARLVPTGGWVARPGKPKDCLHGSPAVPWYNSMILNVLDAVLYLPFTLLTCATRLQRPGIRQHSSLIMFVV